MIDLYGTLINETEIIGVGPLMVRKPYRDPGAVAPAIEREYYFQVQTRHSHFTITTDWLPFTAGSELAESEAAHKAIALAHHDLRAALISGSFTGMRLPHPND